MHKVQCACVTVPKSLNWFGPIKIIQYPSHSMCGSCNNSCDRLIDCSLFECLTVI